MSSITVTLFIPLAPQYDPRDLTTALEGRRFLDTCRDALQPAKGWRSMWYGPVVEEPRILCVMSQWESQEAEREWHNTDAEGHAKMSSAFLALMDGESALGMEVGMRHFFTRWTTPIVAAIDAPVTELGCFSFPDALATEESVLEFMGASAEDISTHPVMTVGKALGGACGYVYASQPEAAEAGNRFCFTGVFGYHSVKDHWTWRATPEHAEIMVGMKAAMATTGFRPVDVLGESISMFEKSGMLHVEFRKPWSDGTRIQK